MYAPVSNLVLKEAGDRLIGFAAPVNGPAPCLLRLTADDIPIATARATRFSSTARDRSIRLGWCGVKLPGLAMAAARGTDLRVRCGVTDRILWQRSAHAPLAGPRSEPKPLTVFDIIALSRAEEESPSLAEIRPIMQQHLQRLGADSFINATYETFLRRSAERAVFDGYSNKCLDDVIDSSLSAVLRSAEYASKSFPFIPGPFSFFFKYDVAGLDL